MPRPDWIEVGRVSRPHGVHGEVRTHLNRIIRIALYRDLSCMAGPLAKACGVRPAWADAVNCCWCAG